MKEFLKSVLASAFGTVLALFIGAFLLIVLLVGMASSAGDGQTSAHVNVKPKTMLVIGGGLTIEDTPEHGAPGLDQLFFGAPGPRLDLLRALEAIDLAAKDKQITGILLSGELSAGLTQKAEIRRALAAFKKSGKPVIAWVENASQGEYYLASVADKVYAHVSGEVEFKGLASYNMYFGDTLRLAGLGVQVTKVGKYKSAVEPYLGGAMSPEAKEQTEVLMNGLWKRLLADVARSRGMTTERLTRVVESGGVFSARKAVELKLADAALHRDELVNRVREAGAAADDAGTSFRRVGLHRYAHKVALPSRGGKIAIVYAEGEIVDGWGGPGEIGGDRLAHDLRSIRGEDDFKAVVLRVNSPGGSAFASDVVAREVALLKKKGVPVVARLGARLVLEADPDPGMPLALAVMRRRRDRVGEGEETGGRAALGLQPVDQQAVLVIEHLLEALPGDVTLRVAVDGVADPHVVGGHALRHGPRGAARLEEVADDLLAGADLGEGAVGGTIQVDG